MLQIIFVYINKTYNYNYMLNTILDRCFKSDPFVLTV